MSARPKDPKDDPRPYDLGLVVRYQLTEAGRAARQLERALLGQQDRRQEERDDLAHGPAPYDFITAQLELEDRADSSGAYRARALTAAELDTVGGLLTEDEALQLARMLWEKIRNRVPRPWRWIGDRIFA